ncbi:MAG: EamA family transporter [Kiritimatiellaceae bacterium]|nr:EamA family transporter [Kiritimatiellaceae bacterium]
MWIYLGLISSVLLGLYDVCKKHALNHNAVLPVLFLSTVAGFLPMPFFLTASRLAPEMMQQIHCYVPVATLFEHLHILLKAGIVSTSWVLAYFAMKHLPISLFSPIRASGPAWTLLGAVLLFHERPLPMQWAGIAVIFCSYYAFSLIGRKEGVVFHRSKWILYIFLATLIGSVSTLYDKYLIQQLGYTPMLVQFWFAFYNVMLIGLFTAIFWWPRRMEYTSFEWRWSIMLIGLLLISADFVYFNAVKNPDALIVILSLLRRSSVVISFAIGAFLFGDVNRRGKAWALAGVLAGVILIVLA